VKQISVAEIVASGGARTSRQPSHFQVSTVVRQVISCELLRRPEGEASLWLVRRYGIPCWTACGILILAVTRAFDLARPGVAPPLIVATIFGPLVWCPTALISLSS